MAYYSQEKYRAVLTTKGVLSSLGLPTNPNKLTNPCRTDSHPGSCSIGRNGIYDYAVNELFSWETIVCHVKGWNEGDTRAYTYLGELAGISPEGKRTYKEIKAAERLGLPIDKDILEKDIGLSDEPATFIENIEEGTKKDEVLISAQPLTELWREDKIQFCQIVAGKVAERLDKIDQTMQSVTNGDLSNVVKDAGLDKGETNEALLRLKMKLLDTRDKINKIYHEEIEKTKDKTEKKYIHYGSNVIDAKQINETRKDLAGPQNKPSGFWASPVESECGWKEFCESEEFHTDTLNESVEFNLTRDARILEIHSLSDIKPYVKSGLDELPPEIQKAIRMAGTTGSYDKIDMERLEKDYDGLEFFYSEMSYDEISDSVLYGWDCDSICIWNPEVIEVDGRNITDVSPEDDLDL